MERNSVKNWLAIGISITAVVLLVLGSLSNVVGYQSVKSTTVNDSPLFTTRTQRATNQQQNSITSQYLGMGKVSEFNGLIPSSNNEKMLLQKALKRLQGMDDTTFNKFLENVLYCLRTPDKYKEVNVPQLIFTIHQIKENPILFEQYLANNNKDLNANDFPTICTWFPGCVLFAITGIILDMILILIILIFAPTVFCIWYGYECPHMHQ